MPGLSDRTGHGGEAAESLRRDLDDLKRDLNSLQADLRGLVRDMVGAGRASASGATHRFGAAVSDSVRATREQTRHMADAVEEQIRERPYMSCGIALAAGVVIGSMLSHKR